MINRAGDPRTDDRIVYELLRVRPGSDVPEVIGTATFRRGTPDRWVGDGRQGFNRIAQVV